MDKQRQYVKMYKDELAVWRKRHLSGSEWDALMVIADRTWGWHRTDVALAYSEIAKDTGRNRRQVMRAIERLKSANILGWQGRERQKLRYCINPPEVYTPIEANLVTKMVSDEANPKIHHSSAKAGDKDGTNTGDISGTNLVTLPYIKAVSPLNKSLIKKEITKRKDDSSSPPGDVNTVRAIPKPLRKNDETDNENPIETIIDMPICEALEIWRSKGAPVIHVGPGENCFDMEDDLISGNLSNSQLEVVKRWLIAKGKTP